MQLGEILPRGRQCLVHHRPILPVPWLLMKLATHKPGKNSFDIDLFRSNGISRLRVDIFWHSIALHGLPYYIILHTLRHCTIHLLNLQGYYSQLCFGLYQTNLTEMKVWNNQVNEQRTWLNPSWVMISYRADRDSELWLKFRASRLMHLCNDSFLFIWKMGKMTFHVNWV